MSTGDLFLKAPSLSNLHCTGHKEHVDVCILCVCIFFVIAFSLPNHLDQRFDQGTSDQIPWQIQFLKRDMATQQAQNYTPHQITLLERTVLLTGRN